MNRLIITRHEVYGVPCDICALEEDGRICDISASPAGDVSLVGNIYVAVAEEIVSNIGAAFVRITPDMKAYLPLKEEKYLVFSHGRRGNGPLRPGDEILVQVKRDPMKGKLASVSALISIPGRYLILNSTDLSLGVSRKLKDDDRARLTDFLVRKKQEYFPEEEMPFGVIVRTNARTAPEEELSREFDYLVREYGRIFRDGRSRTCYSALYRNLPPYLQNVRDFTNEALDSIMTDVPEFYDRIAAFLKEQYPEGMPKLSLYEDRLLSLFSLTRLQTVLEEAAGKKVWLKSGGFLVIEQTEAFVSIDVNSGKFTGRTAPAETVRRINLEAAREIPRQLRLRNLSGIILVDFINMDLADSDCREEIIETLRGLLFRDPVKTTVVDFTPLYILEMTRRKKNRPLAEALAELKQRQTPARSDEV